MTQIVFLTYMNRSGSTFLCQRLSEYDDILVCPEAETLIYNFLLTPSKELKINYHFINKLDNIIRLDSKLKYWNINTKSIIERQNIVTYFDLFYNILDEYKSRIKPKAKTIIFKGTRLINIIPILPKNVWELYNIKVIGLIRDPRAILYSQRKTIDPDTGNIMCKNPVLLAKNWIYYTNRLKKINEFSHALIVIYEDLINQFDENIKLIIDYIGMKNLNKEAVGDLYLRIPMNQKAIHPNILKKPDHTLTIQWKTSETKEDTWIFMLEKFLESTLQEWNYNIRDEKRKRPYYCILIKLQIDLWIRRMFTKYWYNWP